MASSTRVEQTSSEDNNLFVAAIDFGTSYFGYAWSSKEDFKNYQDKTDKEPKIYTNPPWNSGGRGFFSEKTPTSLLLNSDRKLVAFGYDAENQYADLSQDEKHSDYYFFQRFKMNLHKVEFSNNQMKTIFFIYVVRFETQHTCKAQNC